MTVQESAPVGSVVGRIWAKDRDIGVNAEMTYSIIDGDGRETFDIRTDPTNLFGIITIKKVRDPACVCLLMCACVFLCVRAFRCVCNHVCVCLRACLSVCMRTCVRS